MRLTISYGAEMSLSVFMSEYLKDWNFKVIFFVRKMLTSVRGFCGWIRIFFLAAVLMRKECSVFQESTQCHIKLLCSNASL